MRDVGAQTGLPEAPAEQSGDGGFLHRQLGLSKAASLFRMKAAELIQRNPEIVEPLRDGRLCITTVASLAKVLTPANRAEVLPRFFHRSGLEAKAIVAELAPAPNPATRTVVTVTAGRTSPSAAPRAGDSSSRGEPRGPDESTIDRSEPPAVQSARSVRAEPLTPTETRLHLTVSPEFLEKLEAARLALSHLWLEAPRRDRSRRAQVQGREAGRRRAPDPLPCPQPPGGAGGAGERGDGSVMQESKATGAPRTRCTPVGQRLRRLARDGCPQTRPPPWTGTETLPSIPLSDWHRR